MCLPVLFFVNSTYSQGCCGIGGSLVSGGHPILDKYTVLLSSSGNYADAKNPERHRGGLGVMLAYGVTDRLSLSLQTSYVWATSSYFRKPIVVPGQTYPGETITDRNNDFGDGYAAVQFAFIRLTPINKQELIAGIDVGLPWGPDRKMVDGVVLPGNVQTGTGGYSVNGFLTYLKAFPALYYAVTSTIAGQVKLEKWRGENETRRVEDPGDEFSVMLTSLFGPFFATRESITFSYHQFGKTRLNDTVSEDGTSGKRFSLLPALEYSMLSDLMLSISADIPLWRDSNQSLYGNNKAFKAQLFWFIHLPVNSSKRKVITL